MSILSDRRQMVLRALIEEYVSSALPVGSKTITERYALGVSPATVRSELSALEESGYIAQPHTSAGRIPTDSGYRAFVDALLSRGLPYDLTPYASVIEQMKINAYELDQLLEQTSSALMRLTDCLSIVLAPSVLRLHIKQISLISLDLRHVLIIVVTEDGQVLNRHVDFSRDVLPEELAAVQNYLSESFCGSSVDEIKEGLESGIAACEFNPLLRRLLDEVLLCVKECGMSHAKHLGLTALLSKPEFSDSRALLPVLHVLEDETVLLEILDDIATDDGDPIVRIGSENRASGLSGVSVVASHYGRGDSLGAVVVIGPTRMDYSKVISAVHTASMALQDI